MTTYVALLRGINVGGKNRLPMSELKAHLEHAGFQSVRTYIQSGNIVFEHPSDTLASLADGIADVIESAQGFRPSVVVLDRKALKVAVARNPYSGDEGLEKTLHLYFLSERPCAPDFESMDVIKGTTESYRLIDAVFYLHTPDGFGRSKLAQRVEKLLGVNATARNWRTVHKVMELATE